MPWFRNLIQLTTATARKQSSFKAAFPAAAPPSLTQLLSFSTEAASPRPQAAETRYAGLGPTKGDEKPRVVVLGTGWAGCRLMKGIDTSIYDIVCVSPRNHMVFTPLLASTCVGTLEFRSVAEPVGRIQPAISREPNSYFFLANCSGIDFENHTVCPLSCSCFHFLTLMPQFASMLMLIIQLNFSCLVFPYYVSCSMYIIFSKKE